MNIIQGWFRTSVGVDLGTANTLIYLEDYGVALREPSVIAMDRYTDLPLAVGGEARAMLGRTPESIRASRPLRRGVVSELKDASCMFNEFIKRVPIAHSALRNPELAIAVPAGITNVEKIAIKKIAESAHASKVYLPSEPLCAAIGASLPVEQAVGSMVVDIGGGTTEVAVLALGGVIVHESIRTAGDDIDEAIIEHLKVVHRIETGPITAEQLKIRLGSAWPSPNDTDSYEVCGVSVESGLPRTVTIYRAEVREAISRPLSLVVKAIKDTLEKTPPELVSDIIDHGMIVVGGGSYLQGLEDLILNETSLPVTVPEDPMSCVAEGTGKLLLDPLYNHIRETCEFYK